MSEGVASPALRRVTVVGGGAWGTTLAAMVADRADTLLWAREPEVVVDVNTRHRNEAFLPGFDLPPTLRAAEDLETAVSSADLVVAAVPAQHVRAVMEQAGPAIAEHALVLSVTKGIELSTGKRMSEVIAEVAPGPGRSVGVLAGPNLAREVSARLPAATTVAFADAAAAHAVQGLFMSPTFRVYTSSDVIGCEIGGAVKNVIAIAAGVVDALGCGSNTMAALVTRGLAELSRLGVRLGGDPLTFLGLAGNGDLVATCTSPQSRNHRAGQALAAGQTAADIARGTKAVSEGVTTAPAVLALARRLGVEMPITEAVVMVLEGRSTPQEAVDRLMGREPKAELHGLRGS